MMRFWPLLVLIYPLTAHLSIVYGVPLPAALLLVTVLSLSFRQAMARRDRTNVLMLTLYAVFTLMMVEWIGLRGALYLPPVVMNASVAYLFARSLMPGRTDLITLIATHVEPEVTPAMQRYARRACWAWMYFSASLAIAAAVLALYAPMEIWSWSTNVLNYLLIAGFFIGEWLVRMWVLGRNQTAGPLATLRAMSSFDYKQLLQT